MEADYVLDYDVHSVARAQHLYLLARIKAHPARKSGERSPLNLSVVLDRSGSMQGDKLAYAKQAAQFLVQHLGVNDRFSLVTFDHQARVNIAPTPVIYKDNINQTIQEIRAGGGTNLSGGWLYGCRQVAAELVSTQRNLLPDAVSRCLKRKSGNGIVKRKINRVLLLTDGLANYGVTHPEHIVSLARMNRGDGITTTTMGVGLDFNEDLLTRMASEGGGSF